MNTNWAREEELRLAKKEARVSLHSLCVFVDTAIRSRCKYALAIAAQGMDYGEYVVEVSSLDWVGFGDTPELSFSCERPVLGGVSRMSFAGWELLFGLLGGVWPFPSERIGHFPKTGTITIYVDTVINEKSIGSHRLYTLDESVDVTCSLRKIGG